MWAYRSESSPAAENSIDALALRNPSIYSILQSRVSFMLITILAMINPLFKTLSVSLLQAHPSLEMHASFRLMCNVLQ